MPSPRLLPSPRASVEAELASWMEKELEEERKVLVQLLAQRHEDFVQRLQRCSPEVNGGVRPTGSCWRSEESVPSGHKPQARGRPTQQPREPTHASLPSDDVVQEQQAYHSESQDEDNHQTNGTADLFKQADVSIERISLGGSMQADIDNGDIQASGSAVLASPSNGSASGRRASVKADVSIERISLGGSMQADVDMGDIQASASAVLSSPSNASASARRVSVKVRESIERTISQTSLLGRSLAALSDRKKIVLGHWMDGVSGLVICLNVFMMAIQTEYNSFRLAHLMVNVDGFEGSRPAEQVWPHAEVVFEFLEWSFGFFFCAELALRLGLRIRLRPDAVWNSLDFLIIVAWGVERLNSSPFNSTFNPTILRLARLIRLMRLVKLLRHMRMFDALHLLIKAIQSSMSVLMWTVVVLLLLMMVVAMVNASLLENFIKDSTQDDVARTDVFRRWGSFFRAYVSMFEITLANWGPQCWLLMNNVSEIWGIFFIVWRCCFGFAVIQVITSVFIQHTFKVASRDEDVMIQEKAKASEAYLRHLDNLFTNLDESGDGFICREEFDAAVEQPRVRHWFAALEIDVSDVPKLFTMLDDGDGQISKEEFIHGLKKVKGTAQSVDLLHLMKEVQRIGRVMGLQKSPSFVMGTDRRITSKSSRGSRSSGATSDI